jgi:regulator of PEP synthase PpsR (kinase-PPPase family)
MSHIFGAGLSETGFADIYQQGLAVMPDTKRHFHLHLISDSTGETLIAASRAVASQYEKTLPIEHVYPMVRNRGRLDEVLEAIDEKPGIVLFTIADEILSAYLTERCREMGIPCISLLRPIFDVFQSYLGIPAAQKSGAQHELNAEYFKRIDALNFTLMHDDGQLPDNIEQTDVLLMGISRTSKTPTSIYLANRGIKTANFPLVPNVEIPRRIIKAKKPLVVVLVASTDRIHQIRQNRVLGNDNSTALNPYTDRASIAEELAHSRKLSHRFHWPRIDVTRKSIEETAAAILALWQQHCEENLKTNRFSG